MEFFWYVSSIIQLQDYLKLGCYTERAKSANVKTQSFLVKKKSQKNCNANSKIWVIKEIPCHHTFYLTLQWVYANEKKQIQNKFCWKMKEKNILQ